MRCMKREAIGVGPAAGDGHEGFPGDDANDGEVHGNVNYGDADEAEED